jgi:hypothetical protein
MEFIFETSKSEPPPTQGVTADNLRKIAISENSQKSWQEAAEAESYVAKQPDFQSQDCRTLPRTPLASLKGAAPFRSMPPMLPFLSKDVQDCQLGVSRTPTAKLKGAAPWRKRQQEHEEVLMSSPSNGRCNSGSPTQSNVGVKAADIKQGWDSQSMKTLQHNVEKISSGHHPIIDGDGEYLTVMIKNIPCGCKRDDLFDAFEGVGFLDRFNFFYMPLRRLKENLGYAFIGFPDPDTTRQFAEAMTGYHFASKNSTKVLSVVPAAIQGLPACIEHFRNTRTMTSPGPPIFVCPEEMLGPLASPVHAEDPPMMLC